MKSLSSIVAASCAALATFAYLPAQAQAQAWPNRSVQVIVPGAPGDGADLAGRLLGQKLQEKLGQSFVIDNKTGLLVEPNDPEALAEALQRLADDPALTARLAEAGHTHVTKSFDLKDCLDPLLNRYKALLETT